MSYNGFFTSVQTLISPGVAKVHINKLAQSVNREISDLQQKNWNYTTPITGRDKLFEDALDSILNITFDNKKFGTSREYAPLKEKGRRPNVYQIENTFKEFLKNVFFIGNPPGNFDELYSQLTHAWRSRIPEFLLDAIGYPIRAAGYDCEKANPTVNITYEDGAWHLDLTLSGIQLNKADESYPIPGKIKVSFILTNHFHLQPETYKATNPLLDQLCLKNAVPLSSDILKKWNTQEEQEFQNNLDALQVNINELQADMNSFQLKQSLQKTLREIDIDVDPLAGISEKTELSPDIINKRLESAQIILNEAILARSNFGSPSILWLNKMLKIINDLLSKDQGSKKSEEAKKSELRKLIAEAQKHSWSKILLGALLCFAGTFLAAISCAAAAGSLGTATGASLIGFIAAGAMIGAGSSMLFTANKKDPLLTTTKTFVKIVENTNDDNIKPKSTIKRGKQA